MTALGTPPAIVGRRLSERQAEAAASLLDAAEAEVAETGYEGLSVRKVAQRASMAPATAYNYFSSKDHLLIELLWRRLAAVPEPPAQGSAPERLAATVDQLGEITHGSPEVVAACTQAMLSSNPDVAALRSQVGIEIARRITAALGDEADAELAQVLVITYFGALLSAGMGHMAYEQVPGIVGAAARRMLAGED